MAVGEDDFDGVSADGFDGLDSEFFAGVPDGGLGKNGEGIFCDFFAEFALFCGWGESSEVFDGIVGG